MKALLTSSLLRGLPKTGLALATGIAGLVHANPAQALGGGVTISQSGGVTTVTVSGAVTTSKPATGNLSGVTDGPYDLEFKLASTPTATSWVDSGGGLYEYRFSSADPTYSASLYTDLTGTSNILTGTYLPQADASSLRVSSNGEIRFNIVSTIFSTPPDCYTGKLITGATGSGCNAYLNTLELIVPTSVTGVVPPTNPAVLPTIGDLLSSYIGTYNATGSLSSGGSEDRVLFRSNHAAPVPSPLPILGASMAFGFSRRLRQRIAQSKAATTFSQRGY